MAGWDPTRFDAVQEWPLRDLFLAYLQTLKADARRAYETSLLVWAILQPYRKDPQKAPDPPEILR